MKLKFFSALILSTLLLAACQPTSPSENTEHQIVTSFYPVYFLTTQITQGVQDIEVINLIPSGAEPHSYEPSPGQLAQMENSDLVIAQGEGLEPWLDGITMNLSSAGVPALILNEQFDLMDLEDHDEHHDDHDEDEEGHDEDEDHEHEEEDHEHEEEDHEHHHHGEHDPHTWLDPLLMIESSTSIHQKLVDLYPEHASAFSENLNRLQAELDSLDESFRSELASCELDAFITSHDAFSYLASRYGLEVHSVAGISPFSEPSASELTELIEVAEDEGISHIYFEVLANPKAAEVLADEAGLTSLVLDPVASATDGKNYIQLMQENLESLKMGLACN